MITSGFILLGFLSVWFFVRPKYSETIVKERMTIVSQLQEYSLRRTDNTIRNWLNALTFLGEDIKSEPENANIIIRRAINYTPGLIKIKLTDTENNRSTELTRTIYNSLNFPESSDRWFTSRLDSRVSTTWIADSTQSVDFFIARLPIQVVPYPGAPSSEGMVLELSMYFNARPLTNDLTNIPLGDPDTYEANIVTYLGNNVVPNVSIDFPSSLIGEASFSSEITIPINDKDWYVLSSRFETVPFWHIIAVQDTYVLQPVRKLMIFTLITGLGILFIMILFSWYVSLRMNQPIAQILNDVEHISNLDFDHSIREVSLPEFSSMQETLENIRLTLHRYQKINVEKIILEEWKNRYMMTYTEDMIGIIDSNGKFRFVNNHLTHFIEEFALNPQEINFKQFIRSSKIELNKVNHTVHYPDPYVIRIEKAELVYFKDEGTNYYYDYQLVSFEDGSGNSQGSLVILHDKTNDRLVDIERTNMINIIVHELKNPITGVVGLSKLMIDNSEIDENEQKELLKDIYLSGERMNDLVNRFLDVQRLEYGRIPVEFSDVDLFQVINDVKYITNPLLNDKKLKIDISAKGSNFVINGAKDLIFDAVQNLVSNAIKYGEPDRTIEIELVESSESIEVSVTDFGLGISVEDQQKVFEKFYRVRSKIQAAREKGTGLGLAYVKEIMNKHKGDILLESNEEIGSRFTLVFPKNENESA